MLKYIKKRLFKYFKNNNINNNINKKTKQSNLFNFTKKEKKKMSEKNFLKIIKDSGLSPEDVLKILKKEGKIKDH